MMKLAVHQPDHLPYPGFFASLLQADRFVVLDDVQFARRGWQNRNRISGPSGEVRLTVPVKQQGRYSQMIMDTEISDPDGAWRGQHWRAMTACYGRAPYFHTHRPFFSELYAERWERLIDLNMTIIEYLAREFDVCTPMQFSSALEETGAKTELLRNICCRLGANTYVAGSGSRNYLDTEMMEESGVDVEFSKYTPPRYGRGKQEFIENLSAVDVLFHRGPQAAAIIHSSIQPEARQRV